MKAVVVGAGIAGLAVASGLRRAGWDAVVLERASGSHPSKSGLSLWGNGFRALDALGLGPAVEAVVARDSPYRESGLRLPSGRWLVSFSAETTENLRAVDRTDLHRVLIEALEPGTVRWGQRVTAIGAGVVEVDGGPPITDADLIIGADGIRSRVRQSMPQDRGTRYSGYGAWRAITARPVEIPAGGETWGPGRRFGIVPLKDGRVYWFAVAKQARHESGPDALREIRDAFGDWHAPIRTVIDGTRPDDVHYLPIEELARPLSSYVHDRTVLIGDAAHAMTPNLGQGANQALEDAATLCAVLPGSPDDLGPALQRFDRARRRRTQRIAQESRRIGLAAQWTHPLAVRVRDALLAAAPDSILNARTIRLQSWEPPAFSTT